MSDAFYLCQYHCAVTLPLFGRSDNRLPTSDASMPNLISVAGKACYTDHLPQLWEAILQALKLSMFVFYGCHQIHSQTVYYCQAHSEWADLEFPGDSAEKHPPGDRCLLLLHDPVPNCMQLCWSNLINHSPLRPKQSAKVVYNLDWIQIQIQIQEENLCQPCRCHPYCRIQKLLYMRCTPTYNYTQCQMGKAVIDSKAP